MMLRLPLCYHQQACKGLLGLLCLLLAGSSAAASLDDLCTALGQDMAAQAAQRQWQAKVQCVVPSDDLRRQFEGHQDCAWQELPMSEWQAGPMGMTLRCGRPQARRFLVPVKLSLNSPLWVTTRALKAGDLLGEADLRLETMAWPTGAHATQLQSDNPVGRRLRRGVQRGEALTSQSVAALGSLQQGSAVEVVLASGAVEMRAKGRLTAEARVGDSVSVQLNHKRDLVTGTLSDEKTVLIDSKDSR